MVKPRIVLLIFVSGKVVLTGKTVLLHILAFRTFSSFVKLNFTFVGAKVRSEIDEAFENIYPILKGFRKNS